MQEAITRGKLSERITKFVFPRLDARCNAAGQLQIEKLLDSIRRRNGAPHTVLLSSARQNQGKSFIAVQLAIRLAERGERVLLADADFLGSDLSKRIGVKRCKATLADFLQHKNPLKHCLDATSVQGITIMPAGQLRCGEARALRPENLNRFLRDARCQGYTTVIFDTAPSAFSDAAFLLAPYMHSKMAISAKELTAEPESLYLISALGRASFDGLYFVRNEGGNPAKEQHYRRSSYAVAQYYRAWGTHGYGKMASYSSAYFGNGCQIARDEI